MRSGPSVTAETGKPANRWIRMVLWLVLFSQVISSTLITIDFELDDHPVSYYLAGLSHTLAFYWFHTAVWICAICTLVAVAHAIFGYALRAWWSRVVWVVAMLAFAVIAVPAYCVVALRRAGSAERRFA